MSERSDHSKQVALSYLQAYQQGPEEVKKWITDDFKFYLPQSCGQFLKQPYEQRGLEGLMRIAELDKIIYKEGVTPESKIHFVIAEDDWVVLQTEVTATMPNGEKYHNYHAFSIRVEGDKVAEEWEHVDTLYEWLTSWRAIKDYPKVEI